ncbi:natterin-3 [Boleophthalmus pectinirostris]|uniref:natterin-3 n=1 Tax=Boleophthalmus pectinirostris TaxID=150288 RepID=UPI002432E6CB|nr:natterin-3 [Boleophthalmus pectinirostris]
MRFSGFVLLAALALTSARVQDVVMRRSAAVRRVSMTLSLLNPELEGRVPDVPLSPAVPSALTPPTLDQDQSLVQTEDFLFGDNVNLEWIEFDGSIPNGAVSIYNGYTERTDVVCKYKCEAGFYSPELGPFCRYPYGDREYYAPDFHVLANKDNFEFLEWKEDSHGSVPKHSVRTCANVGIYVGKNKYGLGKVVPQFEAFFLPWEGDEYWYKSYQVLTINRDMYTQHISDVRYALDEAAVFQFPPETMQISGVTNNECQTVSKTVTLSKTTELETTWSIGRGTMIGVTGSITAKIPFIGQGGIELGGEKTLQFDRGTTRVESMSHSVSVELSVPPSHSCRVRMEGRRFKADVPYSARLSRTYANGDTQWTSVSGTYDGVQIGEVRAVVDRCEPVPDARPCP